MTRRATRRSPGPDVRIEDHGSIVILQPLTSRAREWTGDHLPADAMRWAGGIVIEPRYIGDIVTSLMDDGLTVV